MRGPRVIAGAPDGGDLRRRTMIASRRVGWSYRAIGESGGLRRAWHGYDSGLISGNSTLRTARQHGICTGVRAVHHLPPQDDRSRGDRPCAADAAGCALLTTTATRQPVSVRYARRDRGPEVWRLILPGTHPRTRTAARREKHPTSRRRTCARPSASGRATRA